MRRLIVVSATACCCFATSCTEPNVPRPTDTRWQRYVKNKEPSSLELELPNHNVFGLVVAVSPDFKHLAYSNLHGAAATCPIVVADFGTAKTHVTLDGHADSTQCVAFSGDGQRVVSGGATGDVIVWDVKTGAEIARNSGHDKYVRCVACSHDGKLAASGGDDSDIAIWSLPELTPVRRLKGHTSALRHGCLVWSSDGRHLLSGSWDGSVRLWNVDTGENSVTVQAGYGRVMSIALSPNADRALSSYLNGPDQPVIYWDLKNSRELKRFGVPGNPWHADKQLHIAACDISNDGSTALLGTVFGTVLWWDLNEWAEITHSQMHMEELGFVLFDDNDDFAVSIGCDRDTVRENARIRHWRLVQAAVDEAALEETAPPNATPNDRGG